MAYFDTDKTRRINGYSVAELQPFISQIQRNIVGLNAMMAMLLMANNIDAAVSGMHMGHIAGPSRDDHLREITANIVMLRTILRTIETK